MQDRSLRYILESQVKPGLGAKTFFSHNVRLKLEVGQIYDCTNGLSSLLYVECDEEHCPHLDHSFKMRLKLIIIHHATS